MIRSILLLTVFAQPALAQGTTQDDVLSGTLRPGWQGASGTHVAALHLELAQNWKTYWRAPGDAGIPPSFDWSGSRNLKSLQIKWPSPEVFHTNGLTSIGYHHELVLPFEVVAIDPSKPVHLSATIELGVCKDICMPASLDLSADLMPPGKPDAVITAALAARPATAKEAGVRGHDCTVQAISDGMRVTARIDMPKMGRIDAVVLEPGIPGVWVSEAEITRSGHIVQAVVDMVPPSGEPFSLTRDHLVLTVIGQGGRAVELIGCPAP